MNFTYNGYDPQLLKFWRANKNESNKRTTKKHK